MALDLLQVVLELTLVQIQTIMQNLISLYTQMEVGIILRYTAITILVVREPLVALG